MLYIGGFLIVLSVLIVWRCYCAFLSAEIGSTRAFLRAMCDYREKMRCYLKSPKEWALDYSDADLPGSFLTGLRDGESLIEAYRSARADCYLTACGDEALESCLSGLGDGYLDTELAVMDSLVARLGAEEKHLADEITKRKRIAGAMLGACAVGVVILVI